MHLPYGSVRFEQVQGKKWAVALSEVLQKSLGVEGKIRRTTMKSTVVGRVYQSQGQMGGTNKEV